MCCIICNTMSTNSTITLQSIVWKQLKEEELLQPSVTDS